MEAFYRLFAGQLDLAMDNQAVVIIGGGISGLAAAHRLRRRAPQLPVVLIEARNRLGGMIETIRSDGFIVEAGPDSFLASKPPGIELCQALGIDGQLIGPDSERRRTYVYRAGVLHQIPAGLTGLVPAQLEPLLESPLFSPAAKVRLQQEPSTPARTDDGDETLASFIDRRFGIEVYDRLIEPLMAGIYAGDGALLSLDATFPQLRKLEIEYGSIVRGLEAQQASREAQPRPGFLTPRTGMQALVEALRNALTSGRDQ